MRIIPWLARVQTNVYYKKAGPEQNLMSKDTEGMDTERRALKEAVKKAKGREKGVVTCVGH